MKPEPKGLSGLQRICRNMGIIKVGGVLMAWDFSSEKAVPESTMKIGSKRWRASEKSKHEI